MNEDPPWLAHYIEQAKSFKPGQGQGLALRLQAMLLRAIDLENNDDFHSAAATASQTLKLARKESIQDKDQKSLIADLCILNGRCLLKLADTFNGVALYILALKLYTHLYGINDGRSQNCVSNLRAIFSAETNWASRTWLDFFCSANLILPRIKQLGLMQPISMPQMEVFIGQQAELLHAELLALNPSSIKENCELLQQRHLADLIYELYKHNARGRQVDKVLLFTTHSQNPPTRDQCTKLFALFNDLIQSPSILVEHRYAESKDGRLWLYYKKGSGVANGKASPAGKVNTIYKHCLTTVDDMAMLFNCRLDKLQSTYSICKLANNTQPDQNMFMLLDNKMRRELKQLLPIQHSSKQSAYRFR